jgi:hypothetical protein
VRGKVEVRRKEVRGKVGDSNSAMTQKIQLNQLIIPNRPAFTETGEINFPPQLILGQQ